VDPAMGVVAWSACANGRIWPARRHTVADRVSFDGVLKGDEDTFPDHAALRMSTVKVAQTGEPTSSNASRRTYFVPTPHVFSRFCDS
jgi:2-keto-4-pentenoate hydratase